MTTGTSPNRVKCLVRKDNQNSKVKQFKILVILLLLHPSDYNANSQYPNLPRWTSFQGAPNNKSVDKRHRNKYTRFQEGLTKDGILFWKHNSFPICQVDLSTLLLIKRGPIRLELNKLRGFAKRPDRSPRMAGLLISWNWPVAFVLFLVLTKGSRRIIPAWRVRLFTGSSSFSQA